jgi:hypothetical protein
MQKDTPKTFKKRTTQAAAREYEYDAAAGQLVYADGARLTAFIAPDEVQKLLGCSRTVAREPVRSLSGGPPEERGSGLHRRGTAARRRQGVGSLRAHDTRHPLENPASSAALG